MKKLCYILIFALILGAFSGCAPAGEQVQIAATTLPVYEFTSRLCDGTGIAVGRVVTESVSCLHDYSLQTRQMRMLEGAEMIVINGAGLEDFLELDVGSSIVDASVGVTLICPEEDHHHEHEDHGHSHENDPHIWLNPENAKIMAQNICWELCDRYPAHADTFRSNLDILMGELDALLAYGESTLSSLDCRQIITFHDGFAYFADAFDLTILKAVEEESGSEASAAELIELTHIVEEHGLNAIFIEEFGSVSAADIIAAETGAQIYTLDMAMGGESYFEAMYHNIDIIKEALG